MSAADIQRNALIRAFHAAQALRFESRQCAHCNCNQGRDVCRGPLEVEEAFPLSGRMGWLALAAVLAACALSAVFPMGFAAF